MNSAGYRPDNPPSAHDVRLRRLRYRCYTWGAPGSTPLWLLHGWADCASSFQFLADELGPDYYLLAPDWRGFGDSDFALENYWFPDYLADLEELLDIFTPGRPVTLVGHSMGGNIAGLYAGIRPQRVESLICLDGAGMDSVSPDRAPARYAQWLDELAADTKQREFSSERDLVRHLQRIAPSLTDAHASFVAEHWSIAVAGGRRRLKMDSRHRGVNPVLYRREEATACWRQVTARSLFVFGSESRLWEERISHDSGAELQQHFRSCRIEVLQGVGHMLHIEAPDRVAAAIRVFLSDG